MHLLLWKPVYDYSVLLIAGVSLSTATFTSQYLYLFPMWSDGKQVSVHFGFNTMPPGVATRVVVTSSVFVVQQNNHFW